MHTPKLAVPLMVALLSSAAGAHAVPFLGGAEHFAILGAQSVTNSGVTTLHGDLGVSPGIAVTGADGIVFIGGGSLHQADVRAMQAQADARAAYNRLAATTGGTDLSGQDLGSVGTFSAGVYHFATSAALTGAMTIDFANDPHGVVIFQIGSTLTTAAGSVVNVINGTSSNGIYFQVGSAATLGAAAFFAGNILAQQSVSFGAGASIGCGRALALDASVTLIGNSVSNDCNMYPSPGVANDYGSNGYSGFGAAALAPGEVPEPGTLALFGIGLGLAALGRRAGRAALQANAD